MDSVEQKGSGSVVTSGLLDAVYFTLNPYDDNNAKSIGVAMTSSNVLVKYDGLYWLNSSDNTKVLLQEQTFGIHNSSSAKSASNGGSYNGIIYSPIKSAKGYYGKNSANADINTCETSHGYDLPYTSFAPIEQFYIGTKSRVIVATFSWESSYPAWKSTGQVFQWNTTTNSYVSHGYAEVNTLPSDMGMLYKCKRTIN